jgi:hypothetical protein
MDFGLTVPHQFFHPGKNFFGQLGPIQGNKNFFEHDPSSIRVSGDGINQVYKKL